MIMPVFTYYGYTNLGSSESRKRMIHSIESRSFEIFPSKCSLQNFDLLYLTIGYFLQRAVLYLTALMELHVFHRLRHNALNTRNNGKTARLPKVRLDFVRRSFSFWVPQFSLYCL